MQVHQRPIRSPIGRQAAKAATAAEAARKPIERVVDPAGCGNGRQSSLDREGQMTSKCERRAVQGGKTGGRGRGEEGGREGGQRTIEQTCSTSQLEDGGGQKRRRESGREEARFSPPSRAVPIPTSLPTHLRRRNIFFSVLPSHLT